LYLAGSVEEYPLLLLPLLLPPPAACEFLFVAAAAAAVGVMNLERFVEWNLKTNGLGSWSCDCFSKEDVVGLFRRPTMKRFALDTTRASLIIFAVVGAAAQCCIPFKCKKEGEGKKTLKAFNPEIFFPAALVFHSSSEFLTKQNHHQHNKTKQVNKQANNVHKKGFKLSLQLYPREITPVHHPTNPREISLECHIHFSIFGYHKRTRHPKYPSLSLCSSSEQKP
jgi:hypothetical protein